MQKNISQMYITTDGELHDNFDAALIRQNQLDFAEWLKTHALSECVDGQVLEVSPNTIQTWLKQHGLYLGSNDSEHPWKNYCAPFEYENPGFALTYTSDKHA